MADLKKRVGRVSVKGKFGPTQRGSAGSATPFEKSPGMQKMRGGSTDAKRHDMAARPGPHSRQKQPTVHSPITDEDEPAPGAEIEPSTFADQDILPDFAKQDEDIETNPATEALTKSNDDDSAAKEAGASPSDGQSTAQTSNEASLSENDDNFYKKNSVSKMSLRGKLSSVRTRIIIGIVTAIVSTVTAVMAILPGAIVTTFTDMLAKVGDVQVSHQFRYQRKWTHRVKDLFSRDGRRGSKFISEMEGRGYRFQFDEAGNIAGVRKPGARGFTNGAEDIGGEINDYMDGRIKLRKSRWKDKTSSALYNKFGVKRNAITSLPREAGVSVERQVNKDLRTAASNTDIEIKASRADIDEDTPDATKEADEVGAGNVDRSGTFEELGEHLDDGGNYDDFPGNPALIAAHKEVGSVGEGSIDLSSEIANSTSDLAQGFDAAKKIALSTDILDRMCTLNRALKAAVILARTVRSYNLYLATFRYITASDGIRKGEARSDLVREIGKRIVAPDFGGRYAGSSSGFSTILHGGFSKSKNDETRSAFSLDARLSGWQKSAHEISEKADLGGSCKLWTNGYFQGGLAAGELVLTIASIGGWSGVKTAAQQTVRRAVSEGFTKSITRALKSKFATSLAGSIALDLSFDQSMILIKMQTEKMLAGEYSGQEGGELLADMAFGGMGVASRQRSLRAGQVPTLASDYAVAYDDYQKEKKEELKNSSVFARYFDFSNVDSLAFRTKTTLAFGAGAPSHSLSNILENSLQSPTAFAQAGLGLLGNTASAQGSNADLIPYDTYAFENGNYQGKEVAVDFAGNIQTTMPSAIESIDPDENIVALTSTEDGGPHIDPETLEPTSSTFLSHIENCVDAMDVISVLETGDSITPENDCFAEQPLTKRFKAHLAYLDMVNTVDAHAFPEEIDEVNGQAPATSTTTSAGTGTSGQAINAEGLNGYVIPCQGIKTAVRRVGADSADWSGIADSGTIGRDSTGVPIKLYIRDACAGETDIKTVVIVGSVHGSENGGQLVAHELLFNESLPANVRIVAVPEYCSCAGTGLRGNQNGVDLNRNNAFEWDSLPQTRVFDTGLSWSKGNAPASEPETQAMNRFLLSLGRTNVSIHYHDSLNYVVGSSQAGVALGQQYAIAGGLRNQDDRGRNMVPQRGSLDGWYNQETGTPTILVEMGPSQSDSVIKQHVKGVLGIINGGSL